MSGKSGATTFPGRARNGGRGARVCQASGFVRRAQDVVLDVRQGWVSKEFADLTPGFGTAHPQDRKRETPKSDPTPIPRPNMDPNPGSLSARDMGYTDAQVREAIRRGVPLSTLQPGPRLRRARWGEDATDWGTQSAHWGTF